jgi:hypothetical protein
LGWSMKQPFAVGVYVAMVSVGYLAALAWLLLGVHPQGLSQEMLLGLKCAVIGGLGGCFYCLRGMYLNISIKKQWGGEWVTWYLIRPFVSAASGAVAYLFMKAGLLILESGKRSDASDVGFFCVAFIAGLNVDRFVEKIEDVAASIWGIKKSRASSNDSAKEQ